MDQQLLQIELLKARGEPDHVVVPLELAWKRRNGILLPNPHRVCWNCVIDTIPRTMKKRFEEVWNNSLWNEVTNSKNNKLDSFLNPIGHWDTSRCDLCYNQYGASTLDIANMGFWQGVGRDKLAGDSTTVFWFPGCVKSNVTHYGEVRNIQQVYYYSTTLGLPQESFEFTCFCLEYEWELRCRMPCGNWTMIDGWVDPTIPHAHPFSVNIGYREVRHYFNEYRNSREDDPSQYLPQAR